MKVKDILTQAIYEQTAYVEEFVAEGRFVAKHTDFDWNWKDEEGSKEEFVTFTDFHNNIMTMVSREQEVTKTEGNMMECVDTEGNKIHLYFFRSEPISLTPSPKSEE